jgi:hypothetical protein
MIKTYVLLFCFLLYSTSVANIIYVMYMQNGLGEGETVCYLFSPKGDDYMREGKCFISHGKCPVRYFPTVF